MQVTMGETPPCWLSTNVPQDARQQHADQHQIWAEKKAAYNDKQAIAAKHFLDTANQALQQENWETNTLGVESKLFLATNHHVFESGSQVEVWFAPRYGSQYEKVTFPLCDEQGDLWLRHVNGEDPDLALLPITMKSGQLLFFGCIECRTSDCVSSRTNCVVSVVTLHQQVCDSVLLLFVVHWNCDLAAPSV